MKAQKSFVSALLVVVLLLVSCSSAPVTKRKQLNLTSDSAVVKMTMGAFEQMKSTMPISHHRAYNEMLQNVGNRISQQVFSDQPLAEWEFVVFDQNDINAFAMPGGKVGIFTGLFQVVKTEEELAAVVAHEIAHVTAKHTHERISQAMIMQGGGTLVGLAAAIAGPVGLGNGAYVNMSQTIMGLYGIGASGALTSWDRGKEAEADHIGIIYMARAGYNPMAAVTVMERMAELENGMGQAPYGTTHPSSLERLDALHGYLDDAMAEYEAAKDFHF